MDFLAQLLIDGVLDEPVKRLKLWRADRRMSSGCVECALKVVSGSQHGLSNRWRHVVATVSPGHIDAREHWWRAFRAIPTVTVIAVRDSVRSPTGPEIWSIAATCRVVEIETPTATLAWAVVGRYLSETLERLQPAPSADAR